MSSPAGPSQRGRRPGSSRMFEKIWILPLEGG